MQTRPFDERYEITKDGKRYTVIRAGSQWGIITKGERNGKPVTQFLHTGPDKDALIEKLHKLGLPIPEFKEQ